MKIIIASSNNGKIQEIQAIFKSYPNSSLEIGSITALNIAEPDEPYDTFMENACHKAKYYAGFTKSPTLSEDAGLCIEALGGFPGVKTKDFLIECGGLDQAYDKLQEMLKDTTNYSTYFVCAAALYIPQEDRLITHEGIDHGSITFPPRGEYGFGFDPIFIPNGYTNTMAELGEEVKLKVGHRSLAIRGILDKLLGF